jgi:hypothetical protein
VVSVPVGWCLSADVATPLCDFGKVAWPLSDFFRNGNSQSRPLSFRHIMETTKTSAALKPGRDCVEA